MCPTSITPAHRWIVPVLFLGFGLTFYFSAMPLFADPDVPWHLAAGRLLLRTHSVPTTDPWSFASHHAPWYLLSWAWDLLLAVVERAAGLMGVFLFAVTTSAALMAFLAASLLHRDLSLPSILLTILLGGLGMLEFVSARPQLAGYAMLLAFHSLLHASRTTTRYATLLALPPLMLLWANAHGSFIAGFTVLGAYVLEAFVTKDRDWLRWLLVVSLACTLAVLANPYGIGILSGVERTLGSSSIMRDTVEWQPFTFGKSIGLSAFCLVFLLASHFGAVRIRLADKVLAFLWLCATLYAIRNAAILIVLSAPYVAACLDEQTRELRSDRRPSLTLAFVQAQPLSRVWAACLGGYALFSAMVLSHPSESRLYSKEMSVADVVQYAMMAYPRRHYLTDFNYGGQVIYWSQGRLPMFMDSRSDTAYDDDAMRIYADFFAQSTGWEQRVEALGVDGIIVGNRSEFAKLYAKGLYRDHWQLMFEGQIANVYLACDPFQQRHVPFSCAPR